MLIFTFLLQAVTATAPVETVATAAPDLVVIHCPSEPTLIPPFGQSCAAKQQAARVSDVIRATDAKPVEPVKTDEKTTATKLPAATKAPAS